MAEGKNTAPCPLRSHCGMSRPTYTHKIKVIKNMELPTVIRKLPPAAGGDRDRDPQADMTQRIRDPGTHSPQGDVSIKSQ